MSGDAIIVGTDGSDTATLAVDKAGELAELLGAPVHVVCAPSYIAAYDWPPRITAQEIVAAADDRLRTRGVSVQTHIPAGDAAPELVAVAESQDAQMIVVGNKGMTGARRLLGSLPNRVSHLARCNVLVVPTQSRSLTAFRGGSVVVGTDGSARATRAVKEAIRLAKALDGELHIVSSSQQPDCAESAVAAAAAEAAAQDLAATTHALHDDPADALLDVAEKSNAAIVIVGNKGLHADERELFGNVPDKLSHTGAFNVLLVFTAGASDSDADTMSPAAAAVAASGEEALT
jgi:nucleotide-binding universal stress UspA family protein